VTKITLQNHVQRIRRRPAPDAKVAGPAQMPETWHEFTGRELGAVLGVSPRDAEEMLDLARLLEVNLPGTRAAFRAGILSREKAALIAWATALLDPAEARKAEAMVLGRAGSLTRAGLRGAIRLAVMQVNPEKAKKRREGAAKRTRVERWSEGSGNAGLAGPDGGSSPVLARAGPGRASPGPRPRALGPGPRPPAPGAGRAGGRGDPARVRRPVHLDHPCRHPPRFGGPAQGDGRDRPDRPGSWSKYARSLPIRASVDPGVPNTSTCRTVARQGRLRAFARSGRVAR
jgi:hypothetical protein